MEIDLSWETIARLTNNQNKTLSVRVSQTVHEKVLEVPKEDSRISSVNHYLNLLVIEDLVRRGKVDDRTLAD